MCNEPTCTVHLIKNHCFNRLKAIILTKCLPKILCNWKSLSTRNCRSRSWGQKQIRPSQICPNEVLQWLGYKVYYLLVKNSKVDGRGGLKERGFLPLKREGILERGLIEDLCRVAKSFEVDGWVVNVSGQSRDILSKNTICKEMPSRVVGQY